MFINTILALFCLCFVIHIFFYLFICSKLAFKKNTHNNPNHEYPSASVIICARDEEAFLQKYLPYVLEQDYPEYEVIVVNDCSADNTQQLLAALQKKYPHLRSLIIKEDKLYKHNKKLPLTIGIRSARYEHLAFMDADCRPASNQWLRILMGSFDNSTEIVLGYGAYMKKKGIVNYFIRTDTFQTGLQYLSLALAHIPYMGVGRNLAYKKSLFIRQKGFAPYHHIMSGDDDLFVNKAATRYNTRIICSPDSITLSEPKRSFKEWRRQKRRHVSTARYYKFLSFFILGILTFGKYLFWVTFVFLLFTAWWQMAVVLFCIKLFAQLLVYYYAMQKTGEKDLLLYSPIIEWALLFGFYPSVAAANMLFKQVKWKTKT